MGETPAPNQNFEWRYFSQGRGYEDLDGMSGCDIYGRRSQRRSVWSEICSQKKHRGL